MIKPSINAAPLGAAHGGNVHAAAQRWGISSNDVIDFSANINPMGTPPGILAAIENGLAKVNLETYPDARALVSAVAKKHNIGPDEIIIGNGAASLMFAVLRAVLPARVLVLEPAFGEYLRACRAIRAQVTSFPLREEDGFTPKLASLIHALETRQCDLLILNSPHNPTGTLYPRKDLLALVGAAQANNVAVMLDEAFIDYAPESSLLPTAVTQPRLVVLRSLTKFCAMPGLRVGYAVSAAGLAAAVREQIEAWSVSSIALEAGRAAMAEDEYKAQSRRVNTQAREEFSEALRGIGLHGFPSAANFLLVKLTRGTGAELARWLESHRTLIRRCDSFRGLGDAYVRLAVRSRQDNLRLISLIEEWLNAR